MSGGISLIQARKQGALEMQMREAAKRLENCGVDPQQMTDILQPLASAMDDFNARLAKIEAAVGIKPVPLDTSSPRNFLDSIGRGAVAPTDKKAQR